MPDLSTFLPCPERFRRKGPHELAGPCPACGGRDRFLVWPDRPRGGAYLCRQCGARGDGIQFLRDFCRLSYADACRTLGLASGEGPRGTTGRGRRPARPTGTRAAQTGTAPFVPSVPETFPPAVLPPDAWREQAGAFLAGLCAVEGSPEAAAGICAARFLRPDTCRALGVGWNGADTFPTRQAWGLPPLEDRRKLLLPRGIVIATRRRAGVVALAIRVPDEERQDGKRPKYWQVAGSANVPFVAGRARAAQAMAAACFEDQLAYGMDRGDFRAAEQTIQTLHEMGSHKEAARLQEALALSREAYTALSGGQDLSLIQQEGDARKRLDALVTPENARGSIKMREQVEAQMKKRRDAFLNDPAGFVEGIPESWRAASTTHEPGTVAFFAERSRRRLALQRELGQGLPYTPRILTDSEAQNARNEYDRQESPAAKAAYLGKLQVGTGDYFPQVLRELKMPPSVMAVAPVFSSLPQREAGLFLEASGLKPGDIPGGHDSDLRKEAEARVDASDIMQAVTGMAQDLPTSPRLRSLATHMRQAMVNADLLGLAPDTLDGMFTVIDDSGMRLVIPRSAQVDTDDLEDVLRSARKDVFRAYMQASTAAAGSYEDRLNAAKARALAENGIFVSSGDGTGAVLVDPVSGAPVALPDGRLVRVPYAEVPARARKARDARMKQDLQEAVDTAMEGF